MICLDTLMISQPNPELTHIPDSVKGTVCENCTSFRRFGEKCWFFWKSKKACTQFVRSEFAEPEYVELYTWPKLLYKKDGCVL